MPYELDPNADLSNTSWVADVKLAPVELVRALGTPHRGADKYKVSGVYSFVDGRRVFTVYDWKSTSLYDEKLPSPLEFWNSESKVCFSIGSNCKNGADFKRWLLERVSGTGEW